MLKLYIPVTTCKAELKDLRSIKIQAFQILLVEIVRCVEINVQKWLSVIIALLYFTYIFVV